VLCQCCVYRWAPAGGGSIFSFKDSIPEAPARALPPQEAARLARLQAEAEVPSVFGYRWAMGGVLFRGRRGLQSRSGAR
jgi:hypothetical protein